MIHKRLMMLSSSLLAILLLIFMLKLAVQLPEEVPKEE